MQEIQIASGHRPELRGRGTRPAQGRETTTPPARSRRGTLLTGAMVVQANEVTTGKYVLGLALKDGQWPVQLVIGDHVAIYAVSGAAAGTGLPCVQAGSRWLRTPSCSLWAAARAHRPRDHRPSSAATDVTVAVSPADAGAVACNASGQNCRAGLAARGRTRPGWWRLLARARGGQGPRRARPSSSPSPTRTG